jgi:chromosome segregation ATPase
VQQAPLVIAPASESDPSPIRELREALQQTITVEADPAIIAARDAHHLSIIGSLATFEVRLREAYDRLANATDHADSLRNENNRLSSQLAQAKSKADAELSELRRKLDADSTEAREQLRNADYERASLRSEFAVAASAAQQEAEVERSRIEELKLEHLRTVRDLQQRIHDAEDKQREHQRHSANVTQKLRHVEEELAEANRTIDMLTQELRRDTASIDTQYAEEDFLPPVSVAISSPSRLNASGGGGGTVASYMDALRDQRIQAAKLTSEVQEWKSLAMRLKSELKTVERQHAELANAPCQECDTAGLVIAALRDKNRALESQIGGLEMSLLASPTSQPRESAPAAALKAEVASLRQQLAAAHATSQHQKSEIQDLRGLLAVHIASPTRRKYP